MLLIWFKWFSGLFGLLRILSEDLFLVRDCCLYFDNYGMDGVFYWLFFGVGFKIFDVNCGCLWFVGCLGFRDYY